MSDQLWIAIIAAIGGILGGGAVINWLKDRKKDNATAKLTDVEALQKQVVLLTTIVDFVRKENNQLQADLETETTRSRSYRNRLIEVEEELQAVRRTAAHTQAQCDDLSHKLKLLLGEEKAS